MNKECENAVLYFYGELEPAAAEAFRAHMAGCSHCQQEIAFLERAQEALLPPAAPQSVVERVLAPAKEAPKENYLWHILRPALATVLVLGVGVYVFVAGPKPDQWLEDSRELVAYVSEEADMEYNQFVADFEAFEREF